MDYKVIVASDKMACDASKELEKKVNSLIKEGYKPLGGVSSSTAINSYFSIIYMSQAMIKE